MIIFVGWMIGLLVGATCAIVLLVVMSIAPPTFLGAFASMLTPIILALPGWLAIALAILILVGSFLIAYEIATASIAPLLAAATGFIPPMTFPLPSNPWPTHTGGPIVIPASRGELFGRGVMIGLSAAVNTVFLSIVPGAGLALAVWAFVVISLGMVIFVARSRFYQAFLGWSGWLFPLSYLATIVGLLLFVLNVPFGFSMFGITAFAIDWTTGVIESRLGFPGSFTNNYDGGFSLGNFTFLSGSKAKMAGPAPARFITPSFSSHETGHSLTTALVGGVVLWINAIDQNVAPVRSNLAYGELIAEGHAEHMTGPSLNDFSLRFWL